MHIIWSCDYGCSKSFLLYAIYRLCCISGIRTSGSFEPVGSRLGRSSDTAELKSRKKERKQIEEQEEKEENLSVLTGQRPGAPYVLGEQFDPRPPARDRAD